MGDGDFHEFMKTYMEKTCPADRWDAFEHELNKYRDLSKALKLCGYYSDKLDAKIQELSQGSKELKQLADGSKKPKGGVGLVAVTNLGTESAVRIRLLLSEESAAVDDEAAAVTPGVRATHISRLGLSLAARPRRLRGARARRDGEAQDEWWWSMLASRARVVAAAENDRSKSLAFCRPTSLCATWLRRIYGLAPYL
jgi:hypothetical protein